MAKTKSERMKEYRARKKEQLGEKWFAMERERTKMYYIPTDGLSDADKGKRRERNREAARKYYKKQKARRDAKLEIKKCPENERTTGTYLVDENGASSTTNKSLIVKLPFLCNTRSGNKFKGGKKRVSRALKKSYRKIETLEDENKLLKRKLKTTQKQCERLKAKTASPKTPKSKTDALLWKSGINPHTVTEIRKRLVYAECLNEEVKKAVDLNQAGNTRQSIHKVVSGKEIKRCRLKSFMQKETALNRRKKLQNKDFRIRSKRILKEKSEKLKDDVVSFLSRDDNSRVLPGKNDAIKVGSTKEQKRVLNDYLNNLHMKFRAESNYKISLASFCRLRPKHISPVNFASRSICLCIKHQNFSFKLRTLKNLGLSNVTSPDSFCDMYKDSKDKLEELLQTMPDAAIKYQQWKRVKMPNGKERMRIIDTQLSKTEFVSKMTEEFDAFLVHVQRVTQQYKSVKQMKDVLPENHILIQMDFSENYSCQTMEEIQSAYWNASMVTLHPTIIYFKDCDDKLCHKSLVFVSEVLHHNAAMVSAILKSVVKIAKEYVPDVKQIHFWTDSPSSQYRNKSVFDLINRFESTHGCKASWHYFESGHGKSACDGVGGTTKRNADNAVKQSKAVIQDAMDFFAWASQSDGEIKYHMITQEDYDLSSTEIEARKEMIKPVKGTLSLHAITNDSNGQLIKRNTSCACEDCFSDIGFNGQSICGWDTVDIQKQSESSSNLFSVQSDQVGIETAPGTLSITEEAPATYSIGDFVVAVYDLKCYIGKITEIDDADYFIDFMAQSGKALKQFRWPRQPDRIWVNGEYIIRVIEKPIPTGKGGRMYTVPDEILDFMST
jgi:hypothetical protein